MSTSTAFILGLVQGITEFLPVSSSGHLVLAQTYLGLVHPPILFDVVVHVGTLVAILVYFFPRFKTITRHDLTAIILGTIPAVIVGLLLEPFITVLFSSTVVVGLGLFITSLLLLVAAKRPPPVRENPINYRQAVITGLFQAAAIIPGISRSGSTVVGGMLNGLNQNQAFTFAFFLAIPAISGALVLQLTKVDSLNLLFNLPNLIGFTTAGLAGLGSLRVLELVITKARLDIFSLYCGLLAVGVLASELFF